MRIIKLMADYQCFPLWDSSPGQVGNIDPKDLPISQALTTQLLTWAQLYDGTLNMDDPTCSGFQSNEDEAEFKRVGNELGARLQAELGVEFNVKIKI
ncbi:hypothetical protein BH11PSE12_BH11PSE12_34570 [soil metagenome]